MYGPLAPLLRPAMVVLSWRCLVAILALGGRKPRPFLQKRRPFRPSPLALQSLRLKPV